MSIKAVLFDIQGTLFDFFEPARAALSEYLDGQASAQAPAAAEDLVRRWRQLYMHATAELARSRAESRDAPWATVHGIYRDVFAALCTEAGLPMPSLREASAVAEAWRHLVPWPDTRSGVAALREHALVATLSNTDMNTVVSLVKETDVRFDAVLTAEAFGAFKPDPRVYTGALDFLGVGPEEALLVASHPYDLDAAAELGISTAFVYRPLELGDPYYSVDVDPGSYDYRVETITELAAIVFRREP